MPTLHLGHDRHNLSRVRQADVVGKHQHAFKRHGPAIRAQALEGSRGDVVVPPAGLALGRAAADIKLLSRVEGLSRPAR
jgi:hypothetical protein